MLEIEWDLPRVVLLVRCHMADVATVGMHRTLIANGIRDSIVDHTSLRIAPDQWLIVSRIASRADLLLEFRRSLADFRAHVVDLSAAHSCVRLTGERVGELLAMGSGVDWRSADVRPGYCVRTRFAQVPAVIHFVDENCVDVYVDRSLRGYAEQWFGHALTDPIIRDGATRSNPDRFNVQAF